MVPEPVVEHPDCLRALTWLRTGLTVDERQARGRAARRLAPRSSHAAFEPAAGRPDPVEMLVAQGTNRVPELLPIRYGRMLASPFTFYRGAAAVMAADLARTPVSQVVVQACGDAHLSNFGLFGTPERRLIFDINDFDETLPGPWEWDVKRLAVSLEVMGRHRGFARSDRREIVAASAYWYRETMRTAAAAGTLQTWYAHREAGDILDNLAAEVERNRISRKEAKAFEGAIAKAYTRDSHRVLTRRTDRVDGSLRITADPPLTVPIEDIFEQGTTPEETAEFIDGVLREYRLSLGVDHHPIEEFRYVHAARKVVGVGSVGTRCWIILLVGRDDDDPLFLQVKEAQPSVLEPYAGRSEYDHRGRRVVAGQRLMQGATDSFLGWVRIPDGTGVEHDFYLRQLHDWKGGADTEQLEVAGAHLYAQLCGATLARAHARWGDRIAIASYLGGSARFDDAVVQFSEAYADQNERDYEALQRAVKSGRVPAETGI